VNDKDLQDAACVFLDHEVYPDSEEPDNGGTGTLEAVRPASGILDENGLEPGINAAYIAGLCAADWGLHHSISTNLGKTAQWASRSGLASAVVAVIQHRIAVLEKRMHSQVKTMAWRSRAVLGTKLRWYRDVEEVDR
jgi:hypothetical protein